MKSCVSLLSVQVQVDVHLCHSLSRKRPLLQLIIVFRRGSFRKKWWKNTPPRGQRSLDPAETSTGVRVLRISPTGRSNLELSLLTCSVKKSRLDRRPTFLPNAVLGKFSELFTEVKHSLHDQWEGIVIILCYVGIRKCSEGQFLIAKVTGNKMRSCHMRTSSWGSQD